ncbi:hypothetical protein NKF06_07290 [Haloferax sp. AB510]|uniref:hypothetical protein n=1 Tax=Haloferax sp. AB510 TaxID=2934172 RepID=UPI00209C3E54|nr:hypothetical protein [Haloferax sp. AB510]MCO8266391.1 hypothetical protein [Haloferax sp. AB510]
MSDVGEFETIAASVLMFAEDRYETLLHTGVNPEEKPIADPVDGFARVPDSNPPHYVLFEFTTTKRSNLDSKWLTESTDPSDKGDLPKAIHEAENIRSKVPEAQFTVVLVSNRAVKSDVVKNAHAMADTNDVTLDIWNVHRLAHFLINSRDGQWLRSKHFDQPTRRLSKPLLRELSAQSAERYQEQFHLGLGGVSIARPEQTTLLERTRSSSPDSYLIPIVGNSGYGKTVTCYQSMTAYLEDGGFALRLEPTDIAENIELSQAIDSALNRLHPTLNDVAGQDAVQLAGQDQPLMLVVDDLNREDNPSQLFDRLRNWVGGVHEASAGTTDQSDTVTGLPVSILCPLWPRVWNRQQSASDQTEYISPIELGPFSEEAAAELIKCYANCHNVDIGEDQAIELATRVECDPHVVGLLGKLFATVDSVDDLPTTSRDVLARYEQYAYQLAAEETEYGLTGADYEVTVEEFSEAILEHREWVPTWRSVRTWLSEDDINGIRGLTDRAQLLLLIEAVEKRVAFRHDRLREYLLSNCLLDAFKWSNTPGFVDDPHYASILGFAIATQRPSKSTLAGVRQRCPLALFEAMREIGPTSESYQRQLSEEINNWIEDNDGWNFQLPTEEYAAIEALQEADTKVILELARPEHFHPPFALARLRNGDIGSGVRYLSLFGEPDVTSPKRDGAIEAVRQKYGTDAAEALIDIYPGLNEEHIQGWLRFAGFLEDPILSSTIADCWNTIDIDDQPQLLPAFVWAGVHCALPAQTDLVDDILAAWAALPEGSSPGGPSDDDLEGVTRRKVRLQVSFSLPSERGIASVEYFKGAVDRFPKIEATLLEFLRGVPEFEAIEFLLRRYGEQENARHVTHQFVQEWNSSSLRGQRLPSVVRQPLRDIWEAESESEDVRSIAFSLWANNSIPDDLATLRNIEKNEPYWTSAVATRLEHGDTTVFEEGGLELAHHNHLLNRVHNAWCPEAFNQVDQIIEAHQVNTDTDLYYTLGKLLFRIPADDAERLLQKYWDRLSNQPIFIQAALYTATDQTKHLAEQAFKQSEKPSELCRLISSHFGFRTTGRSELITADQLRALSPYLEYIDDLGTVRVVEKAIALGMADWARDIVKPHLGEQYRGRYFPSDEELMEQLTDRVDPSDENSHLHVRYWLERFDERQDSMAHAFDILEQWLERNRSIFRYQVVATALKERGSRSDIDILEPIPSTDDQYQRVYDDAAFGVRLRTLS